MNNQLTAQEAALYLGQGISAGTNEADILDAVFQDGSIETLFRGHLRNYWNLKDGAKLWLRPLSDITEEEALEIAKLNTRESLWPEIEIRGIKPDEIWYIDGSTWQGDGVQELNDLFVHFEQANPKTFAYLLSRGFDLFNWIEQGKALDKTKQPA